jgi:hypothetical protein
MLGRRRLGDVRMPSEGGIMSGLLIRKDEVK